MRDKLYAYLKLQEAGVTSGELVEKVLMIKGASPAVSEKLIQAAVAGDRRFAVNERHWKAVERCGIPLPETEFVLLSLLALNTAQKQSIVIEVSAQKIKGDTTMDRFHTLINPGASAIPAMNLPDDIVREIKDGISREKAACTLRDFFGNAVLVGYDIHSSLHQINRILHASHERLENLSLCLRFLTKKLIPDACPKSIDSAASFFKIPIVDTRRTEGEIRTVAEIFARCKELLREREVRTVEEAVEFQYPDKEYVDFSRYAFDKRFLWAIPPKPGIYLMKDKNGGILYVGKAKNLKARVGSYFWNSAERLQKITDLLKTLYSIEYEVAGSEVTAIIREYRLIQQYRPPLNQQLDVRERTAGYGNVKNFILLLPATLDESLELFFVVEGLPLRRYEILKNAVNFSGVEGLLDGMYYVPAEETANPSRREPCSGNTRNGSVLTDVEAGEKELVFSWFEANKDRVNYINLDVVGDKPACLKILKDYVSDEDTSQSKHLRL